MKHCISFILIISFTNFCYSQKANVGLNEDKLIGKRFEFGNGLCSTYFVFLDKKIFRQNTGCEGPGHTNYGTYQLKGDTVTFTSGIDLSSVKFVKIDTFYSDYNDSLLLEFYDQNNENISQYFRAEYQIGSDKTYSLTYSNTLNALLYRRIKYNDTNVNYNIEVVTFRNLGLSKKSINSRFKGSLRIRYYIYFPKEFIKYSLYNKDISKLRKPYSYIMKKSCFIPIESEIAFFMEDREVQYCEVNY